MSVSLCVCLWCSLSFWNAHKNKSSGNILNDNRIRQSSLKITQPINDTHRPLSSQTQGWSTDGPLMVHWWGLKWNLGNLSSLQTAQSPKSWSSEMWSWSGGLITAATSWLACGYKETDRMRKTPRRTEITSWWSLARRTRESGTRSPAAPPGGATSLGSTTQWTPLPPPAPPQPSNQKPACRHVLDSGAEIRMFAPQPRQEIKI